ncbi:hypothetical protein UFOVP1304_19 [uncultured Caudovirales phage]|uniref:Uncharacterized protein n=1 Tax=uncultured Caudovirales phage TaxID=2100421 RepID=A0A6J5RY62_9CAUD|nr:hypothetical protein UFOVP1304_19 [uncultured Caudovirales phage]
MKTLSRSGIWSALGCFGVENFPSGNPVQKANLFTFRERAQILNKGAVT